MDKEHKRNLAVPIFGYRNHASVDQRRDFIRLDVTQAAAFDGAKIRKVVKRPNTGSTVCAETAYRLK